MTTQPTEAVGGSNEPVAAPTLDELLALGAGDEPEQEDEQPLEGGEEAPEAEEAEPEIEAEAEPEEPVAPPLEAPNSWKAEEKEAFAKLPREVQEVVTRREAERERFVQHKAQEAAQVRQQVTHEAMQAVQQLRQQQADELESFAAQIVPQRPPARLMAEDPVEYARQMEAYEYWSAQRQHAQQAAHQRRQEAQFIQQQQEQQAAALEAQQTEAILRDQFPEYLDPNEGPKLREALGSVAIDLGYSPELLARVNAQDILAMKKAADWKAKAEKWDRAMAKQMERVRDGKKQLPPIAKPGVPQGAQQINAARAEKAWEATKRSKGAARNDAFAAYLNATGQL